MNITRDSMHKAVQRGLIETDQAAALWRFFEVEAQDSPSLRASHTLYYLGGMIAIGAMTLFMNLGWEKFGGWGLFAIALAYAAIGVAATEFFPSRDRLRIPAGIMAALVVSLTPLAVYGLQVGLGYWPKGAVYQQYHQVIDWRWTLMQVATLISGAVMLWRYRLPFMVMPIAVTLWCMSMDFVPLLIASGQAAADLMLKYWVSLWFGMGMLALAVWVDLRTRSQQDYAFWLYLFGAIAFWGGLGIFIDVTELGKLVFCLVNLAMIFAGVLLGRRVFVVLGGLSVAAYLAHLTKFMFRDAVMYPFVLSALGLWVICLGILWQRHEAALVRRLRSRLPASMRALLERNR